MNADATVQRALLDLAATDAELARITHRRTTLPEAAEVARLEADEVTRRDAAVAAQTVVDDLDRDIRKLEGEVDGVRAREDRDRGLLAGGTVGAKQMTELQHELETLQRRQGVLEDELLEVMERREASAADHEHAGANLSQVTDDLVDARRRAQDAVADLDTTEHRLTGERAAKLPAFPADLCSRSTSGSASPGAPVPRCCRPDAAGRAGWSSTAASSPASRPPRRTWWCAARSAARSWCAPTSPGFAPPASQGSDQGPARLPGHIARSLPFPEPGRGRKHAFRPGRGRPVRVVVEADGGSRGNPGPAGYGAVVFSADRSEVLAERGEGIGRATNNVAEYRGLIAGLEAAAELDADEVDVRMDSKLVVEQMSGRWKVKHPDMVPLARQAGRLVADFSRVSFQWIPRAQNAHADRLANEAMDDAAGTPRRKPAPAPTSPGWTGATGEPTRLVLLRHGQTALSVERRYSGRGNPPLTELGRAQAAAAAAHVARLAEQTPFDAVASSPLGRARETAEMAAAALGLPVVGHDGLTETDFGEWEGLTFREAAERDPALHREWLGDTAVAPPGGESFDAVHQRVRRLRDELLAAHGAARLLLVSHVTPIKTLLRMALDAGPGLLYRLHLDLASLSTADFYPDGGSSVRLVNDTSYLG